MSAQLTAAYPQIQTIPSNTTSSTAPAPAPKNSNSHPHKPFNCAIDSAKERPMLIFALDRPQLGCHAFYLELLGRINTNAVAADAAIAVDATDKSNVVLLLRWANRTPSWKATSLLMVCSTRCMDPLMSDRSLQQAHRCEHTCPTASSDGCFTW